MLRVLTVLSAVAALAGVSARGAAQAPAAAAADPVPPRRVMGYYPDWAKYQRPAYSAGQIPYGHLTHVLHAFLLLKADGSGELAPGEGLLEPELTRRAHEAGVKVLISVGGGDSAQGKAYAAMAANPAARDLFVKRLREFVEANHYDGADIDWEVPNAPKDTANCTALMRALRDALPAPRLLSMAVTSNPAGWGTGFDMPALTPLVDFFNVMTYDYSGPWAGHAGHNSPLYLSPDDPAQSGSLAHSIDLYLTKYRVPAAKLNAGMPFYGYRFDKPGALWQPLPGNDKGRIRTANYGPEVKPKLADKAWVARFDAKAGAPYLVSAAGAGFITYDDPSSITRKVHYALSTRGLGGVFTWELSADYDGTGQDLLDAMYREALMASAR